MTLAFWLLACLMIGLAVAAVLPPLTRSRSSTTPSPRNLRLAAYRARLAELEQEVAGGALSAEEAQAARIETERELLRAVEVPDPTFAGGLRPARRTAVSLLVLVPIACVALYLYFGQPALIELRTSPHPDRAALEKMVDQLAQKLRETPDDVFGWRLLARSYAALDRNEEAVAAL
ncbi:MAG: c-type cytochrome biogenesis protein CcmI, partial [Burkholderiales bacterium]